MKLICVLVAFSLISCNNQPQPEKTISHFAKENIEQADSILIYLNSKVGEKKIKRKSHLEKLNLNGRVASMSEVYHDIYPVGDVYYKVNTCSGNWDPNDVSSVHFNVEGFVTKTIFVNARYNSTTEVIYTYDAENKTNSSSTFFPENYKSVLADFHFFGQLSDTYFRKDTIISIFDKNGYLKEKRLVDLKTGDINSSINLEYEFDNKGNWIKCILYENDIPIGINERSIQYYN